jgi:NADH-quinone oxidoreductase subunit G
MTTIFIDGTPYQIKEGQNLLQATLSLGFNLPYFCWHPALGSVGACRQCAVKQFKDENDSQGKLVMACMTPAADGARISIDDPEARQFRASVIEWLMANHPHDCPVCDEGGECHLQDMTVMTGHTYRAFRFQKRTHRNQYLGPFVNHEMNRCIACYRCVRFYRDYAGGRDLDVFGAHDHVYFGRHEDGVLENEFSGNLVEVCPTGVFTDKTFKQHYSRKWDLQTAPSICVHCGLGCNTIPGERYGELRRIRNRYNGDVNGYFLCDRGRYGYAFVNSERRIRQPTLRKERGTVPEPVSSEAVLGHLAQLLTDGKKVIGIGSPRASLETNFILHQLVGPEHFYAGLSEKDAHLLSVILRTLRQGPARTPSLREAELADVVLVLGEDLTNTAPRLALSLRQLVHRKASRIAAQVGIPEWNDAATREVVQHEKETFFIATPHTTKLDDVARRTYRAAPDDLARLGFAIAHTLNADAPPVSDLPDEECALVIEIAQALHRAERPLVVSGTSCGSEAVIQAAANVAWALLNSRRQAELCFTVPEANSMGLALLGGGTLSEALRALQQGEADTVIILENDLYRRADEEAVDAALNAAEHVVVIDHLNNATAARADVLLPAATFAEGDGTLINAEGRAQRFFQVFVPRAEVQEGWRWLRDIAITSGRAPAGVWQTLDDVIDALGDALPVFRPVRDAAPPAMIRIAEQKIPRQPLRYSGRTAIHADADVSEPQPPEDLDSPLAFSMEGYEGQPPAALIPRFWMPGWNSVQALNKFQSEIGGALVGGDPGQRLIEPAGVDDVEFFGAVPKPFEKRDAEWLVVPLYHIFGSEELSILTPGIAEMAPRPYLALNPQDADALQVDDDMEVDLTVGCATHRLAAMRAAQIPEGVAGVPAGLPGLPMFGLPEWGTVSAAPLSSDRQVQ